jgi:hypothetical protein
MPLMANIDRRSFLLAGLCAIAAVGLSGCWRVRERLRRVAENLSESKPNVTLSSVDDVVNFIIPDLESRYGEAFRRIEEVEVEQEEYLDHIINRVTLAPASDAEKPFMSQVGVMMDDNTARNYPTDDYTQYRFKDRLEEPFERIAGALEGVAGWSVCLREPYMGRRDWQPDEIDEYMNNGYTYPYVLTTLYLPRGVASDAYAQTVRSCLEQMWPIDCRMMLYAGMEGTDAAKDDLYILDAGEMGLENREPEPPSLEKIKDRIESGLLWEPTTSWDGSPKPGDPGYGGREQVNWNPGHPVMG